MEKDGKVSRWKSKRFLGTRNVLFVFKYSTAITVKIFRRRSLCIIMYKFENYIIVFFNGIKLNEWESVCGDFTYCQ